MSAAWKTLELRWKPGQQRVTETLFFPPFSGGFWKRLFSHQQSPNKGCMWFQVGTASLHCSCLGLGRAVQENTAWPACREKGWKSFRAPCSLEKEEGAGCSGPVQVFPSWVCLSEPTFSVQGGLGLIPLSFVGLYLTGCEEMGTSI